MEIKHHKFIYTSPITGYKSTGIIWTENYSIDGRTGDRIRYFISTEGALYKLDKHVEVGEKVKINIPDYQFLIP